MRYLIALFLLISTILTSFAQQGETLNGKVIAEYGDTNAVYVINSRTEKGILTEKGGYFSINASVGDTILFLLFNTKPTR